jgi:DNA segregation ATPase FtsK/SpoIIIE, S-DNA-T family
LPGFGLLRLEAPGHTGRALLLAAAAAILTGIALSLTSGSAVSGLPSGWGGALGLAAAGGLDSRSR